MNIDYDVKSKLKYEDCLAHAIPLMPLELEDPGFMILRSEESTNFHTAQFGKPKKRTHSDGCRIVVKILFSCKGAIHKVEVGAAFSSNGLGVASIIA